MSKIIVIGCNAFSGGYVVDELLRDSRNQVIGVDRVAKGALFVPYVKRLESMKASDRKRRWRFAQFDLNEDMPGLLAMIKKAKPDYVMNLAALSEVAPSWEHPDQWFETNVVALTRMVNGLKDIRSIKKYCHISTPEVYGSVSGAVKEDNRLNPSTPYAASKAAADLSLLTFYKNYGFPVVWTRAANVYGAHQQIFKILPRTAIYLRLGKKIQLHGGGTAVRAFIHVRDVARAYIAVMLRGRVGDVYHIAPENTVTIRELVEIMCGIYGVPFDKAVEVTPARPGHDSAYILDAGKIRSELKWQPKIPLEKGLKEVNAWVDQYWKQIEKQDLEYKHQA